MARWLPTLWCRLASENRNEKGQYAAGWTDEKEDKMAMLNCPGRS